MRGKQIVKLMQEEQQKLTDLIEDAKAVLARMPEGSVRVAKHKAGAQFYYRKDKLDRNGKYIPASERGQAEELVQKGYLLKLLRAAESQSKAIEKFLRGYNEDALPDVFDKESAVRKACLRPETFQPIVLSDEENEKCWLAYTYQKKGFREDAAELYTQKKERVRSKSEAIIADTLDRYGIPYRYECPLRLNGETIHPDFTILRNWDRRELYWEHLGMMDDTEYRNEAFRRIRAYEKAGIYPGRDLILTVETGKLPMNAVVAEQMIREYILEGPV